MKPHLLTEEDAQNREAPRRKSERQLATVEERERERERDEERKREGERERERKRE